MKKSKGSAARQATPVVEAGKLPAAQRAGKPSPAAEPAHCATAAGSRGPSFGKLTCDGALRILSADARAGRLFGHAVAGLLAQSDLLDLLHCGDRRRAARGIAAALSGQASSYEDELRALRKDGRAVWTFWTFRPTRISQDRDAPSRMSVQIDVIGERAACLPGHAEKLLRQALDGAAIGMRITTPAGRALIVNRMMCEILGYDAEEIALLRDE